MSERRPLGAKPAKTGGSGLPWDERWQVATGAVGAAIASSFKITPYFQKMTSPKFFSGGSHFGCGVVYYAVEMGFAMLIAAVTSVELERHRTGRGDVPVCVAGVGEPCGGGSQSLSRQSEFP